MKYFETLTVGDREALFSFMRDLNSEADRYNDEARKLYPPQGRLAVGAASFDPWLKSAVAQEYLRHLRKGDTPEHARQAAISYGRECVDIHNAKRKKDINWQRWRDSGDSYIHRLFQRTPRVETRS